MSKSYHFVLKTFIFVKKNIVINPDSLTYNGVTFPKSEIVALRYGVKAIHGYRFNIGRVNCIDIKTSKGRVIRVRLISLYGIRKNPLHQKYIEVLRALFINYFSDMAKDYIRMFESHNEFSILGTTINQEGIKLNDKLSPVSWFDVDIKRYWHYYSIFSVSDSKNDRSYYHLYDWNAGVLQSIVEYILEKKMARQAEI